MPSYTADYSPSMTLASWNQPTTTKTKTKKPTSTIAGTTGVTTNPADFVLNPGATGYSEAYGGIPGLSAKPPSLYESASKTYAGLPGLTSGAGDVVKSQLAGELSPETINAIQDEAARFGISSGMPLSGLSGHRGLRNLGLNVEQVQNQGLSNYGNFLNELAKTTDDPALLAQIAAYNAQLSAAPVPSAAAAEQERLFDKYAESGALSVNTKLPGGSSVQMPTFGSSQQRSLTPGAYETPSQVYSNPLGGITYGGTTYYGGAKPTTYTSPAGGTGIWSGAAPTWEAYTSPGEPGGSWQNVADAGLGNFTQAGGGLDFGAMYNAAGLPYTDWNAYGQAAGIDWSIYE